MVHECPVVTKRMPIIPLTRRPGGAQECKHILHTGRPEHTFFL